MNGSLSDILLAIIAAIAGCGWFVDGRKHRKQVEALNIENERQRINLADDYVQHFKQQIVEPLVSEMQQLKAEVNMLNKAVARIDDCHHAEQCPVRESLNKE